MVFMEGHMIVGTGYGVYADGLIYGIWVSYANTSTSAAIFGIMSMEIIPHQAHGED